MTSSEIYSSTSHQTHSVASETMEIGIQPIIIIPNFGIFRNLINRTNYDGILILTVIAIRNFAANINGL